MHTSESNMETLLWNYLDNQLSPTEKERVEQLLATQPDWKERYQLISTLHQELQQHLELDAPSLRFTRNVMEEITKLQIAPATRDYINRKIIYGIAGFFFTLIAGFLVYAIFQINWQSTAGTESGINWGKIDYTQVFNNQFVNVFMMINVVLGLIVLDRYLAQQKKSWKGHSSGNG